MKYVLCTLSMILLSWPSVVIGYIVAAIASGFSVGRFLHERHEQDNINKFCKKEVGE